MRLLRWIWVGNPFYVISALLIFVGLRKLSASLDPDTGAWALLALLSAYIVLLASTAIAIVRLGHVWDDARTIALVVVLLLLSLAMLFDEGLIRSRAVGSALTASGFAFAVLITELLIRGLRLGLPLVHRIPIWIFFASFFLHPLALVEILHRGSSTTLELWVSLFPTVQALSLLSLLPAIRRGRAAIEPRRTPWPWPWFPWTLHLVFILAIVGRSWSLPISFGLGETGATFLHPLLFVPLGLVVSSLLFEIARKERSPGVEVLATLVPVCVVALTLLPSLCEAEVRSAWIPLLEDRLGSARVLASLLSGGAFLVARIRGARCATAGLVVMLLVPALLSVRPFSWFAMDDLARSTCALGVLVSVGSGVRARSSLRLGLALALASLLVARAVGDSEPGAGFEIVVGVHLVLSSLLLVSSVLRDDHAPWLGRIVLHALIISLVAAVLAPSWWLPEPREWTAIAYLYAVVTTTLGSWLLCRDPKVLRTLWSFLVAALLLSAVQAAKWFWRQAWPPGLALALLGLTAFALATTISVLKSRRIRHSRARVAPHEIETDGLTG